MKLQKKNSRHFIKSLKNIDLKMTKTLLVDNCVFVSIAQ